jgi:hypothetical protein
MNHQDSKLFYMANPDISTRLIQDNEAILYHPDTNQEKFINPTGLFIWKRLGYRRVLHLLLLARF